MPRRAVILAGGRGRRLAPYTFVIPKPIVPIGTTPILEIVLRQLARDGFGHVTIALGHMSEIVRAVAGDGSRLGLIVHHTDAEREYAYDRQSSVGHLDKALDAAAVSGGTDVDMKTDWNRIFPFE